MSDSLHCYLNGTHAIFRSQGGFAWRRHVCPLGEISWDATIPLSLGIGELALPNFRGRPFYVYVGSALSKFAVIELPPGLKDIEERRAAAQAQMQHQLGLNALEWHFALGNDKPFGKIVVCAIRRNVMNRIQSLANEHGWKLVSLRPYVVGIWNAAQQISSRDHLTISILVAVENDAFTVMMKSAGAMISMSTLAHRREDGLIDREVRRLSYSRTDVDHQHIGIALPSGLSNMVLANAEKLVTLPEQTLVGLHADFHDLLLRSSAGNVE